MLRLVDNEICDFCKMGRLQKRDEKLAFHQWTDKGYIYCRVPVILNVCTSCGSRVWGDNVETLIEKAVQQEYRKLR
jgi:hypothetical protein